MPERNPAGDPPSLRRLYPNLTDDELLEAEENLEQYLEVVFRIYLRLLLEKEESSRKGAPRHFDASNRPL